MGGSSSRFDGGAEGREEDLFFVLPVELLPCFGETAGTLFGGQGVPVLQGLADVAGKALQVLAVIVSAWVIGQWAGEGACAIAFKDSSDFGEISCKDGNSGIGKVRYAVGKGITVVEAKVLQQA